MNPLQAIINFYKKPDPSEIRMSASGTIIKRRYDTPHDLDPNVNLEKEDSKNLIPIWFRMLEWLGKLTRFKVITEFINSRKNQRNYTIPLSPKLYALYYNKPLSARDRSKLLMIMQNYTTKKEKSFLMRFRYEKYINQHYKYKLYEIAKKSNEVENVYEALYNIGLGFEFNILASGYENGMVDPLLRELQSQLNNMVRFDTIFKQTLSSLRKQLSGSVYMLVFGYFFVVWGTYMMMDVEFKQIPPYFAIGLEILQQIKAGNLVPLITFLVALGILAILAKYLKLGDYILIAVRPIADIIVFFEGFKFFSSLNLAMKNGNLSEGRLLDHSVKSIEIDCIREFLQYKANKAKESTDIFSAFFKSNSLFPEEDLVYIVDTSAEFTDKTKFMQGLAKILTNKETDFSIRERTDRDKIELFGTLATGIVYVLISLLYALGELQTFYINMGG